MNAGYRMSDFRVTTGASFRMVASYWEMAASFVIFWSGSRHRAVAAMENLIPRD